MSPELLSDSFVSEDFTNFIWSDMYSFGLVMWEIISRTQTYNGYVPEKYRAPYEDFVPQSSDPSIDDMNNIVYVHKHRPIIDDFSGSCFNSYLTESNGELFVPGQMSSESPIVFVQISFIDALEMSQTNSRPVALNEIFHIYTIFMRFIQHCKMKTRCYTTRGRCCANLCQSVGRSVRRPVFERSR